MGCLEASWIQTVVALCNDAARSPFLASECPAAVVAIAAVTVASRMLLRLPAGEHQQPAPAHDGGLFGCGQLGEAVPLLPPRWWASAGGCDFTVADIDQACNALSAILQETEDPATQMQTLAKPKPPPIVPSPPVPAPPPPAATATFPGSMRPGFSHWATAAAVRPLHVAAATSPASTPSVAPVVVLAPPGVVLKELKARMHVERWNDAKEKRKKSRSKSKRRKGSHDKEKHAKKEKKE